MPGTNTSEYKLLRDSLDNFHQALKPYIPGLKFNDLFFEIFNCYPTDTDVLEKTDFARYDGSLPIVNGLTKAIVELGGSR